ncbi:M20 family metallopeptidase [Arthrobacter sp. MYb51]|nr:M20 family metallopeptidase [Arthrobacter sp. MYb51]
MSLHLSSPTTSSLTKDAAALQPELTQLRHALHAQPEIGLHLPGTQERVLAWLDGLGYELIPGKGLSSVTAVLRGTAEVTGPRRTVLLRADMDALPVQEATGLPYSSRIDGAMHACGHDLHTTMLAGAATLLADRRHEVAGDVVLMFQPGEEGHDGARIMIEEGVLDASGRRAESAFGVHVTSALAPCGTVMSRPGATMGAADGLFVTVRGAGGHGSKPSTALDPVPVAAEMVTALQSLLTRRIDIFDPAVLTVGVFRAGTQRNIIPDTATFEASLRSFSRETGDRLERIVPELIHGVAAAHGMTADVEYRREFPLTFSDSTEHSTAREVAVDLFGDHRHVTMPHPLAASEDFSLVLEQVPGAFVFLAATPPGADPETAPFNHSPRATFDDGALADGAALYAGFALARLRKAC